MKFSTSFYVLFALVSGLAVAANTQGAAAAASEAEVGSLERRGDYDGDYGKHEDWYGHGWRNGGYGYDKGVYDRDGYGHGYGGDHYGHKWYGNKWGHGYGKWDKGYGKEFYYGGHDDYKGHRHRHRHDHYHRKHRHHKHRYYKDDHDY